MVKPKNYYPTHVAIIPDGNRRWARKRHLAPWIGHRYGAKAFEKVLESAYNLKIPCVSFWGSSLDNLARRPRNEVRFLLKLFKTQFERILRDDKVHKHQVKVNVIGRWNELFPQEIKGPIKKTINITRNYSRYLVNIFLAYSGTDEMVRAIRKIVSIAQKSKRAVRVTENLLKQSLLTCDLPPVDFLIRTGGEPHLSVGFMMWDIASAQLYFSKKLWPDFGKEDFKKAIQEFARRERRFGA